MGFIDQQPDEATSIDRVKQIWGEKATEYVSGEEVGKGREELCRTLNRMTRTFNVMNQEPTAIVE